MVKRGERRVTGHSKASRSGASQGKPPQAPSARRSALARAITPLVAVIAAIALSLALIWWVHTSPTALADGGGGGHFPPHPVWTCPDLGTIAGAPRRWEAGMGVGPYSQVNLRTGRVLTTLPIVGWSGKGPAVSFSLYHNMNSYWGPPDDYILEEADPEPLPDPLGEPGAMLGDASGDGSVTEGDIEPFIDVMLDPTATEDQVQRCDFDGDDQVTGNDLGQLIDLLDIQPTGPQWSHSYSAHLLFPTSNTVTLVWDDCTQDVFTYNAATDQWYAPSGAFLTLTKTLAPVVSYTFTSKAQEKMKFDADGKLEWLQDASGNQVTCTYRSTAPAIGKLWKVTDASERVLELTYDTTTGYLTGVKDAIDRTWTLVYADPNDPNFVPDSSSASGPFVALDDPTFTDASNATVTYRIMWAYTDTNDWNIARIYDKQGSSTVDANGQTQEPYCHTLTYQNGRLHQVDDPTPLDTQNQKFRYYGTTPGNYRTDYVDRRGSTWQVRFDPSNHMVQRKDPLAQVQKLAYQDTRPALIHEPTQYTNALNQAWTATYDARGNMLTTTDPLGNRWTLQYDDNATDPRQVNNLIKVVPPGNSPGTGNTAKQVLYAYDYPSHPTSPSSITLPDDGHGNAATPVALTYYGPAGASANGLLQSVIDANGVRTFFEYDPWGQLWRTTEGAPGDTSANTVAVAVLRDKIGRVDKDLGDYHSDGYPPPQGSSSLSEEESRQGWCDKCSPCDQRLGLFDVKTATCRACAVFCTTGGGCLAQTGCAGDCMGADTNLAPPGEGGGEPRSGFSWNFPCPPLITLGEFKGPGGSYHDRTGRPTHSDAAPEDTSLRDPNDLSPSFQVLQTAGYDHLGHKTSATLKTPEPFWGTAMWPTAPEVPDVSSRNFAYQHDDLNGTYTRTGPDSQTTTVHTDIAGRVQSITRSGTGASLSASYTYNPDNSVASIAYGNGTSTLYYYDIAGRVTDIAHYAASGDLLLGLNYVYSADGLITTVNETDASWTTNTVAYTYDNRNRLVTEHREGSHEYWLDYTYDQGGNRLTKVDAVHHLETTYHYDLESQTTYGTMNNRLMYYEVKDASGSGDPVPLRNVYYEYQGENASKGHPTRVVYEEFDTVTHQAAMFLAADLTYNHQGELWFVTRSHWTPGNCNSRVRDQVLEFKGSGRARYMTRQRDHGYIYTPEYKDLSTQALPETAIWSDYDGDEIYGDYTVDSAGAVIDKTAYLPGIGQINNLATENADKATYYHADHLGTLRVTTDGTGTLAAAMVYTAFGETVAADGTIGGAASGGSRYQYAGDSGYESGLLPEISQGSGNPIPSLPWQHVGYRWYDTSTGRFLQRDPIGILGGLNVYCYADSCPSDGVDPMGLVTIVIQWKEGSNGDIYGHTVTFTTTCWKYMSFVPDGIHSLWDDLQKYGLPSNIWVFTKGVDEKALIKKWKRDWEKAKYDLVKKNCIDSTMDLLGAGGIPVPTKPGIWMPPFARNALDKIIEAHRKKHGPFGGFHRP